MKTGLSAKKTLLQITILLLIGGQVIRMASDNPEIFFLVGSEAVYAKSASSENIADMVSYYPINSQNTNFNEISQKISHLNADQNKVSKVRNYLSSIGAPLAAEAEYFVKVADELGIDYRLVAAISIIESSGGKYCYRPYNAWGWGGQGGAYTFANFEEGIYTVSYGLKVGYYDHGARTPKQIAPYYNPGTPNEWSAKVDYVMSQM